ncbi:MAG: hypothetical protein JSS30_03890 [Verrucomicrobia bacterium]|nr:hypothetical protein [Verrucomicrobiota bacterium]
MLNKSDTIDHFYQYLSLIGNPDNPVTMQHLQRYLDDDFTILSNNEILCNDIHEALDYFTRCQKKYRSVLYSPFVEPPIISGEKAVLHFKIDGLDWEGGRVLLDVMAILTFQNGKIGKWKEVFHQP